MYFSIVLLLIITAINLPLEAMAELIPTQQLNKTELNYKNTEVEDKDKINLSNTPGNAIMNSFQKILKYLL